MSKCIGCNKAIVHTEGKRKRKWCSDACRVAAYRRSIPNTSIPNTSIPNKRGKDIKCFTDLPLDVQQTIERLCPDVVGDHAERCRRAAIAISYQHGHPDRYYPQDAVCSGVVTGKPGDDDYNGVCTEDRRQARG